MNPVLTAHHYEVGSSVTSVELLLEARTAAESAAPLAAQRLVATTGVDGPLEVERAVPGPADWPGARRFAIEARSGLLGTLFCEDRLIAVLADLIMGGRGLAGADPVSDLELSLCTDRIIEMVAVMVDSVQPGRPEPVALIEREPETPARSIVIEAVIVHREERHRVLFEVLAHHLSDDDRDVDDTRMAEICHDVPLQLSFRYTPISLSAADVSALEPGDVICLEHEVDDPVTGSIGTLPLLLAQTGTVGRRAGVEVVDLIEQGG